MLWNPPLIVCSTCSKRFKCWCTKPGCTSSFLKMERRVEGEHRHPRHYGCFQVKRMPQKSPQFHATSQHSNLRLLVVSGPRMFQHGLLQSSHVNSTYAKLPSKRHTFQRMANLVHLNSTWFKLISEKKGSNQVTSARPSCLRRRSSLWQQLDKESLFWKKWHWWQPKAQKVDTLEHHHK